MKKTITAFLCLIVALPLAFVLSACRPTEGNLPAYEYPYENAAYAVTDDGMTIDGNLDESAYAGQKYMTFSQSGATVAVTTVFGERGLYVGAKVEDRYVYYNAPYLMNANTSMEIYVCAQDKTTVDSHTLQIATDTHNKWSATYVVFQGKAVVRGDAENTGSSQGIDAEFFVPWEQLGLDARPASVKLFPSYNHVAAQGATSGLKIRPVGNPNKLINYYRFDERGYINYDEAGAIVGDSVTGISKSCGWDLSGLTGENPTVRSVEDDSQFIFFSGANSDKYLIEATVTPKAILRGNPGAKVGLMIGYDGNPMSFTSTYNQKSGFMLDLAPNYYDGNPATADKVNAKIIDFFHTGWVASGFVYANSKPLSEGGLNYEDGIRLKVVKYDETFFFYIEDTLVYIDKRDYLASEAMPGLFSIGCEAEFSSMKYEDYAGKSEELMELLSQDAYFISVEAGAGGKTAANTLAVVRNIDQTTMAAANTDVYVSAIADSGYRLSSFVINGEDRLAAARAEMSAGVYRISDVTADTRVSVAYEKIDSASLATVKLGVGIIGQGNANPAAATLTVTGKEDRTVYLTPRLSLNTSGGTKTGNATVKLPAGTYLCRFMLDGYCTQTVEVTVEGAGTYTPTTVLLALRTAYGSEVSDTYQDKDWVLSSSGTIDYTREEEGILGLGDNSNMYFSNTSDKSIVKATIGSVRRATGKSDLKAGVMIAAYTDAAGMTYRYSIVMDGINRDVKLLTQVTGQNNLWSDFRTLTQDITAEEGVELTVVRDGENVFVFVDGNYVSTVHIDMAAPAAAGFITVGSTAEYRDFSYITDFTVAENATEYERLMQLVH